MLRFTNEAFLGNALPVIIKNGTISAIYITINGKKKYFLSIIKEKCLFLRPNHPDNISSFGDNYKFYKLFHNRYYVLAVKSVNNTIKEKIRYSLNDVRISRVVDAIENNTIKRSIGNKDIILSYNKEVLYLEQKVLLKPLNKRESKTFFANNPNIGVIDLETYRHSDGTLKVYAGIKTNLNAEPVIFYIDENAPDPSKLVLDLVNELLRSKYSNITFYIYNLSGYDIVYVLHILLTYNRNYKDNKYKLDYLLRDTSIIKFSVEKGCFA